MKSLLDETQPAPGVCRRYERLYAVEDGEQHSAAGVATMSSSSAPAAAESAAAPPALSSKELKGKKKKALRRLLEGKSLPDGLPDGLLSAAEIEATMQTAAMKFEVHGHRQQHLVDDLGVALPV